MGCSIYENRAEEIGCAIRNFGFTVLRGSYFSTSKSLCPSGNMLDLGERTIIYCQLGRGIPPPPLRLAPMNFTGCPYTCAPGYFGNTSLETRFECSGACNGGGQYCPAATVRPLLCPPGTYLPVGVAGLVEESCIPCAPGTFNPDMGSPDCTTCPAGKLSDNVGSTECS